MPPTNYKKIHTARGLFQLIKDFFAKIDERVISLNQSKIFAGLVIIVLNISGKFTTIKLSKTMESYLKYTFSRDILVFSMAWMGTRDIYTALGITAIFVVCAHYLFNEESPYCCLPEHFTDYHTTVAEENKTQVTDQQIEDAIQTLAKAKEQLAKKEDPSKISGTKTASAAATHELWSSAN
jgi:hypothetical protein